MNEPSRQPMLGEIGTPSKDELPYSEDGVDLTLIRWMLSRTPLERLRLTPLERLRVAQNAAQAILHLRNQDQCGSIPLTREIFAQCSEKLL
jgi:hypothetical protein